MGGMSDERGGLLSLAWQLAHFPPMVPEKKVDRFNPRPAGVIREGSTSDVVLQALTECGGFRTEAQLIWITKRSHSAISWALIYLIRLGLVEARPDTVRNSRYQKYRAVMAKQ